jgi:hypothetical protein
MNTFARTTARRMASTMASASTRNPVPEGAKLTFARMCPAEVYPIVVCISGACLMMVGFEARMAMYHPSLKWTPGRREMAFSPAKQAEEGAGYTSHHGGWQTGGVGFKATEFPKEETGKKVTLFA